MRHWIWCNIDQRIPILTSASPRSILVFSGQYYIISNASIVNNCIILHGHVCVMSTGHSVSAASIDICFVYKQWLINSDSIYIDISIFWIPLNISLKWPCEQQGWISRKTYFSSCGFESHCRPSIFTFFFKFIILCIVFFFLL